MDAQLNQGGRRRRRRKTKPQQKAAPAEPIFIAARRPDSPRLEKPTRRMKAASARPKSELAGLGGGATQGARSDGARSDGARSDGAGLDGARSNGVRSDGAASEIAGLDSGTEPDKKRRQARIIHRPATEVDETERNRLRLLSRLMASEGRAAITRAVDEYLAQQFELPLEQEVQLKLLEHFDEAQARLAMQRLAGLIELEEPRQLPLFRQRLRRLEDYADDAETRVTAAALRRQLPA